MGSHIVQFYEDDASIANLWLSFIDTGLRAGDSCVVLATKPHRDSLEAQLRAHGIYHNGATVSSSGSYVALDAAEILAQFMVDGWPAEKRFANVLGGILKQAAKDGNGRVRIFGEMSRLLFDRGKPEATIRLEKLHNQLFKTHSFSLICPYSARALSMEQHRKSLHAICKEHAGICLP